MKKQFLIVAMICIYNMATAQVGIFKNYDDFFANEVKTYKEYKSTHHALGKFKITFINEKGRETKIDVEHSKMWGYKKNDDTIFRVSAKNIPYVIIIYGKMAVYGNYSTEIDGNEYEMRANQFPPQVSMGLNGEMLPLSRKNIKKLLLAEGDEAAYERAKKTKNYYQALVDFVIEYNEEG